MREIIRGNLELIKTAPMRSILGFAFLMPAFLFSLAILLLFGGLILEMLITLLFYGLSGLDRRLDWKLGEDLSRPLWSAFAFLVPFGGFGLKIFLLIPYSLAGTYFLLSAHKRVESKNNA